MTDDRDNDAQQIGPPAEVHTKVKTSLGRNAFPKVLVVDDVSNMVSVLQRHVSNAGYAVDTATNGQDAPEKIKNIDEEHLATRLRSHLGSPFTL